MTNSQSRLPPPRPNTRSSTGRVHTINYSNLNNRGFATTQEELNAAQAMQQPWQIARQQQRENDSRNAPRGSHETDDQYRQRIEIEAQRRREHLAGETEEQTRHRLEIEAQRRREHLTRETEEQTRQRLESEAQRRREHLAGETEEQTRQRLESEAQRRREYLARETHEQYRQRLEADAHRHIDHRALETEEERRNRQEADAERHSDHREHETEEQRADRLHAAAERQRVHREEQQQRGIHGRGRNTRGGRGRGRGRGRAGRGGGRNYHLPRQTQRMNRRPNQRERAQAAGEVDARTAEHVFPDQLANFDHDVDAAILMAAEITGVQRWNYNILRRALQRIAATTDNPNDEPQRDQKAINILREAILDEVPSDEDIMQAVLAFQDHIGEGKTLPACACCGIRALPDEADDYKHVLVDSLDFISYTTEQEHAYQQKSLQAQQMTSCFLYPHNNRRYHLHPELIEHRPCRNANANRQEAQAPLCDRCFKGIFHRRSGNNDMPPLSIAAGHDYGVLSRAVPNAESMTMVERQALTLRRLYIEAIKLQESDDKKRRARINQDNPRQQLALKGHGVVFTHNAAEGVGESLPLFVEEGSLQESLEVIFVGPRPMNEAMRRSGLSVPQLQVRSDVVIGAYDALVNSNPIYAWVPGRLDEQGINRDQLIHSLQRVTSDLVENANFIDDQMALVSEEVATDDVARATDPRNDTDNADDVDNPEQQHGGIHHVMVTSRNELLGGPDAAGLGAVRSLREAMRVEGETEEGSDEQQQQTENNATAATGAANRRNPPDAAANNPGPAADTEQQQGRNVRGTVRVEQTSNEPINEFTNNRELLGGAFPTVFPLGFVSKRTGSLSKAESQHLLRQFTNVAAREQKLIFLLFNQLQRHEASRAVSARVNNQPHAAEDFEQFATDPQFIRNVNDACRVLPADASEQDRQHQRYLIRDILAVVSPFIRIAGNQVPFSPMQRNFGKSILYSLCQTFGMPSIFLTISMDDNYSELNIRLSNPIHSNDEFPVNENGLMEALRNRMQEVHGIDITPAGLSRQTANNPVAAAQTFKVTCDALLHDLLQAPREDADVRKSVPVGSRRKGVLGVIRSYYGAVETQGRGTLHLHLVLWTGVPPNFASAAAGTDELAEAVAQMLDRTVKAELPVDKHVHSILLNQRTIPATTNNTTTAGATGNNNPARAEQLQQRNEAIQAAKANHSAHPMTMTNLPENTTIEGVLARGSHVASVCNMHLHTFSCHKGKSGCKGCRFCMPRGPCPETEFVKLYPLPQNNESGDNNNNQREGQPPPQPPLPEIDGEVTATHQYSDEEQRRRRYQDRPSTTLPPRQVPRVSNTISPADPLPESTDANPIPSMDAPNRNLVMEPQRREITLDMFEQYLAEVEDPDSEIGVYMRALGDRWRSNQQTLEDQRFIRELLRHNGYVSEYNPAVSASIKANTNCMYIGTTDQAKAVLMYLIKYLCKDGAELSNSITVIRDCLEHIHQYPSHMPAEQDRNPAMRPFLQCMSRIINTMNGAAEVPASAAAYTLLGGKAILCPEHTHFAFVPAAIETCVMREQREENRQRLQRQRDRHDDEENAEFGVNDGDLHNAQEDNLEDDESNIDMDDPDEVEIGEENGELDPAEVNTRGSMPLYEVNGQKVPVPQEVCYGNRGHELEFMNYHTWLRTIKIVPIRNNNRRRSEANHQVEAEEDTDDEATAPRTSRERNARFQFIDGFVLAESYEQTLLSKFRILILAGPRPPQWPGPRPDRLTYGWKEKARRYAQYMLVLFRRWDVDTMRSGPLTWRAFVEFIAELRGSDTLFATHTLNQIQNITHCLKVKQQVLKMNNHYRGRSTDIWEGYIDPAVMCNVLGTYNGGNNGGGDGSENTQDDEEGYTRHLRDSREWLEAAMRINNRIVQQMNGGPDTLNSLNRQSKLLRLKQRVEDIYGGENAAENDQNAATTTNNRQQAPPVINIQDRFFFDSHRLSRFQETSRALKQSGTLARANMPYESGHRRRREEDDEDDDDRDRIRRRLNDDDDDEEEEDDGDAVFIPVAGNRRTIDEVGLTNRDRARHQAPRLQAPPAGGDNDEAPRAHLRQLLREELESADLNEQQLRIAEELAIYSIEWKIYQDNPDSGRDPPRPPMLLIHGGPGTGKTHLMRRLNELLIETVQTGGLLSAAYTGVAASLLSGGQTLNKLLDIKLNLGSDEPLPPLSSGKRAEMQRRLQEFTGLLIDEVSMLSPTLLRRVDERLREVLISNQPFGGKMVILQGDMFQLPPVRTTSLYKSVLRRHRLMTEPRRRRTATTAARQQRDGLTENEREGARLFEHFEIRTLNIQQRAIRDRQQTRMINHMRDPRMNVGQRITQQDLHRFRVLTAAEVQTDQNWRFAPVLVCDNETRAVINQVQMCNFGRHRGLPVIGWIDIVRFRYADESNNTTTNPPRQPPNNNNTTGQQPALPRRPTIVLSTEEKTRVLEDNMHQLASYFVPGAPAYLTENINPTINLANGTDVTMHSLGFQFENNEERNVFLNQLRNAQPGEVVMLPRQPSFMNVVVPNTPVDDWPEELRLQAIDEDNNQVIVPIGKEKKGDTVTLLQSPRLGVSNKATVKPLALSESMSITFHKSQGKTLLYAVLDLRAEGLDFEKLYVGITRTQSSENMRIINLSPSNILNLSHLLNLQPSRELLLWLSGFDEETNRWDDTLVRQFLADEELRNNNINPPITTPRSRDGRRSRRQDDATDDDDYAETTRQPHPTIEPTRSRPPEEAETNSVNTRRQPYTSSNAVRNNSSRPSDEPAAGSSAARQQPAAVQLPRQQLLPTYAQPNNSRSVQKFSALFMPIIAAAAHVLPAENTHERQNFRHIQDMCGEHDFATLVIGYHTDFRYRNERPFGDGGYRYLHATEQERLLFPEAGLLGHQDMVGESLIQPNGEVAIALSRVATKYNEQVQQQNNRRRR